MGNIQQQQAAQNQQQDAGSTNNNAAEQGELIEVNVEENSKINIGQGGNNNNEEELLLQAGTVVQTFVNVVSFVISSSFKINPLHFLIIIDRMMTQNTMSMHLLRWRCSIR